MFNEPLRIIDAAVLEGMTSISALFAAKKAGVNDRRINGILFEKDQQEKKAKELAFLRAVCKEFSVPLSLTDAKTIDHLTVGKTHGGIVALCGYRTLPEATAENLPKNGFLCLLDGIEDPYNFGYAVRSLYAAGCDGILLGERNWMSSAAGIAAKSSAGATEALPVFSGSIKKEVSAAKELGYRVVAAGIRNAVPFRETDLSKPLLLIVGGEKRGISSSVSALCDLTVRIPYGRAFRGSLSTASAASVLAFEILCQNS